MQSPPPQSEVPQWPTNMQCVPARLIDWSMGMPQALAEHRASYELVLCVLSRVETEYLLVHVHLTEQFRRFDGDVGFRGCGTPQAKEAIR